MSHPNNHFGIHKHFTKKQKKKTIDTMAYIAGIGGNIAVVPQIVLAWSSDAPGLAIATWVMFSGIGVIWLIYAMLHNQKPLIVAQIVGLCCNLLVVTGWAMNNIIS